MACVVGRLGGGRMKFPCLIDKRFCKTPIKVTIDSNELNEDGELVKSIEIETFCNLQMGSRVSMTKDKENIELSGIALFVGDICPTMPIISNGNVEIDGNTYSINKGTKNYNPDGTVNFTTLELV